MPTPLLPRRTEISLELYGIAAAVLGGCSLRGGEEVDCWNSDRSSDDSGFYRIWFISSDLHPSLNFAVMGSVILAGVIVDEALQGRSRSFTRYVMTPLNREAIGNYGCGAGSTGEEHQDGKCLRHPLSRRRALVLMGGSLGSLSFSHASEQSSGVYSAPSRKRPNVLLLLSNDQRHDTIGALGNPLIFTPNLDRLVKRGTAFTHAFAVIRGMLTAFFRKSGLTGLPVVINPRKAPGASWEGSDLQRIELARLFRDAGDSTVFVGAESPEGTPAQHGFTRSHAFEALPLSNEIYLLNAGKKTVAFSTNVYAQEAAKFIEERASEPWFMQVSFRAPHDPRKAPGKFGRMYEVAAIPIPPNFMPEHPFDNGEMVIRDEELEAWPRRPDRIQQHLADSYGMVSHLDSQIGNILNSNLNPPANSMIRSSLSPVTTG